MDKKTMPKPKKAKIWYVVHHNQISGPFYAKELNLYLNQNGENVLFSAVGFKKWYRKKELLKLEKEESWTSKQEDMAFIEKKIHQPISSLKSLSKPKEKVRTKGNGEEKLLTTKTFQNPKKKDLFLLEVQRKRKYRLGTTSSAILPSFIYYFLTSGISIYFFTKQRMESIIWFQNKPNRSFKKTWILIASALPFLHWYPLYVLGKKVKFLYQKNNVKGFSSVLFMIGLIIPPIGIFYLQTKLNQFWTDYKKPVKS